MYGKQRFVLKRAVAIALGLCLWAGPGFAADTKESALSTVTPVAANLVTGLQSGNNVNYSFTGISNLIFSLVSGDCTVAAGGAITCTKTAGSAFVASAITDTTNAANISSGTIPVARLPLATTLAFGAVKPDGTTVTIAAGVISATGTGSVSTTGSPASGNLTKFSGATSITNGDLSGDVTTSGTLAATLANTAVTPGVYTNTNLTVDSKGRITAAASGSGGGITALTGDVTASGSGSVAASVVRIQGRNVASTAPTNGQALLWVTANSDWEPTTLGAGSGTVTSVGTTSPITGGTFTTSGTIACATCTTSAAALTAHAPLVGEGSQTMAAVAAMTNGQLLVGATGADPVPKTVSGDATLAASGALTVTATGGVAFATSATTDTTNATNITSGTLAYARLPTQLTNTVLGNSSGSTAVPSAQAIGAGLVMNTGGLQTTVADVTKSANYTVAAGDMGGQINLSGTATLTIPAISSTILTTGMSASYANQGSGTWTIASTPTINGLNSTSVPPGGFGTFIGNGSTLDFSGLSTPTTTAIGGVMAKDCSGGSQFVQKINTDGTETCATPAGGGTVSVVSSGNLTNNAPVIGGGTQLTQTTAAMTNGQLLIGVTSSAPAPQTLSQDCTLNSSGVITCTKTNNVAFTSAATTAIGTSGATIPLLSTANTWSSAQSFNSGDLIANGATSGTYTLLPPAVAGSTTLKLDFVNAMSASTAMSNFGGL